MKKVKTVKIIFCGTPNFDVSILEKLAKLPKIKVLAVITEPDRPAGRKRKPTPSPIKVEAKKLRLKTLQPKKIANLANRITKLAPDLIVVAAYGQIIPENILKIPKKGIINVHPSLLPKLRGPSPIQATLLSGLKTTRTTIMLMDKGMDTGPILAQEKVKISPDDDFISLAKKLAKTSAKLLEKTIPAFIKGEIKPVPQNNSKATYCSMIKKEDGVLDFKKPATELENQIKAFCCWPKSFCFWKKKRVIVHQAKAMNIEPEPPAVAGLVFQDKKSKKIAILTGSGSLAVERLQPEGKKALSSTEFLNGYPQIIGDILKSKSSKLKAQMSNEIQGSNN